MSLYKYSILLQWLIIFAVGIFTIIQFSAPASIEATAPVGDFSAERALTHLKEISRYPHPVGSIAHDMVKDYLLEELNKLGLSPEMQKTSVVSDGFGAINGALVQNILARIPGQNPTKAIALFAHYDSVPGSRGASDDGSGVITLLETARALLTSPLKNDVLLVFTDGEENGLLGAQAFAKNHPWAKEIGLFLNFEARGNHGPSTMFRASQPNGMLIPGLAHSAPFPVANSLVSSLAKVLPNDTDFTVLTRFGLSGLDFAFAGGLDRYHTYQDSLENLDPKSLQHHGSYALSMSRYFGNLDLSSSTENSDLIYFDIFKWFVVYYPKILALCLGIGILLLFFACSRKTPKLLKSSTMGVLAILGAIGSVWFLSFLIGCVKSKALFIPHAGEMIGPYLLLSYGIYQGIYLSIGKTLEPKPAILGAILPWTILGAISGIFFPGVSYIFQWPVLFTLIGLLLSLKYPKLQLIACLPAVVLITGLCYAIFVLEAGGSPWLTSLALCFLLSFLVAPHLEIPANFRKRLALGAIIGGIGLQIILVSGFEFTLSHPLPASLNYGIDADSGQAFWISDSFEENLWPRKELSFLEVNSIPAFSSRQKKRWLAKAPLISLLPPQLDIISDQSDPSNGVRKIKLRLSSPRNAACIGIWEESQSDLKQIYINGEKVEQVVRFTEKIDQIAMNSILGPSSRAWELRFCNIPDDGILIEASLEKSAHPIKLRVMDESFGLDTPTMDFPKRSIDTIATPWSDLMLVSKLYSLP